MNKVRRLTEASILTAIAVLFELLGRSIPIFAMPQGGIVSLVLLPAVIVSLRHGYVYGFISGFVIGLFVFLLDGGVLLHWGSLIFDYFLAFTLVGLTAVFKKKAFDDKPYKFIIAITVASLIRFSFHVASGILFFKEFAEGHYVTYSILYNIPYNLVSYLLMIVLGVMIFPVLKLLLSEEKKDL